QVMHEVVHRGRERPGDEELGEGAQGAFQGVAHRRPPSLTLMGHGVKGTGQLVVGGAGGLVVVVVDAGRGRVVDVVRGREVLADRRTAFCAGLVTVPGTEVVVLSGSVVTTRGR